MALPQGWHNIPGYDGKYQINTDGDVRDVGKDKIIKPSCRKYNDFRPAVRMKRPDGKRVWVTVSVLMRDTFMGGKRDGYVVIHKDRNALNNALYNLKFATPHECGKTSGGFWRKPVYKIDKNGEVVTIYRSLEAAGKAEFCHPSTISNICTGKYPTSRVFGDEYTFAFNWEEKDG